MDGILQVVTTEDPSIVAFRIASIDCSISGRTYIDFDVLGVTTAAECVDKLLDSLASLYTTTIMQDRIQDKETLQ